MQPDQPLIHTSRIADGHAHPHHDVRSGVIPPHAEHQHDAENEHLFGFKYWHFFDIISDVARSSATLIHKHLQPVAEGSSRHAGMASRALPAVKVATRALPVVGVVGELMHVATPFEHARDDWRDGKISSLKFGGLCALYGVYTVTGLGGFLTAGIKEGLTNAAQHWNWMDDRYVPHSLYQEFQHAGWFGGDTHEEHHQHHAVADPHTDRQAGPAHFHAIAHVKDCAICTDILAQDTLSARALFELSPPPITHALPGAAPPIAGINPK